MYSAELQSRMALWRQKQRDGTLTQDELKEAIAMMRSERMQLATTSGGSRTNKATKAKAGKPSSDDLLNELEGL